MKKYLIGDLSKKFFESFTVHEFNVRICASNTLTRGKSTIDNEKLKEVKQFFRKHHEPIGPVLGRNVSATINVGQR